MKIPPEALSACRAFGLVCSFLLILAPNLGATELQASNAAAGDEFGYSVSVSGSNGLIGAFGKNTRQGQAYLFSNLGANTNETIFADPSPGSGFDDFAVSVSLSGSHGLIGAEGKGGGNGAAYYYADVTSPSPVVLTAVGGANFDEFGAAVSLDGTKALIGAYGTNGLQGAAYFFANAATNTQVKLTAADGVSVDRFGIAVSLSGNHALVGADLANSTGAAYYFADASNSAAQVKLSATGGAAEDFFGSAVSLSGTTALVGAYGNSAGKGAVYFFSNAASSASQVMFTGFDSTPGDNFGRSVTLSGSSGLVGAPNTNSSAGAAYLIPDTTDPTTQVKLFASDASPNSRFGISVSLDGDLFLIGAYLASNGAGPGKAYSGYLSSVTTLDIGNTTRTIDGISFVSKTNWVVGQTTSGNQVILQQGNSADVSATGKATYIGKNSGSNNNTLLVQGTVTSNSVTISSAGSNGNTMEVTSTGSVTATTITVNNGGTLLLSGSGNQDRISNSTALSLAGGTIAKGTGASEGSTNAVGLGALTLTAASQINFTGTAGTLTFQSFIPASNVLSIINYLGNGSHGGSDQLIFNQDQTGQLGKFDFGFGPGVNVGEFEVTPGFFEVYSLIPIPEPTTWIAGMLATSAIAITSYLRRLKERSSRPPLLRS